MLHSLIKSIIIINNTVCYYFIVSVSLTVNVMFDNTVNFNPGDSVQFITIIALDDNNIEELESTCLELTTPSNQLAYLYPINQANVIIKDDEG